MRNLFYQRLEVKEEGTKWGEVLDYLGDDQMEDGRNEARSPEQRSPSGYSKSRDHAQFQCFLTRAGH
jgi:hypothetical protein